MPFQTDYVSTALNRWYNMEISIYLSPNALIQVCEWWWFIHIYPSIYIYIYIIYVHSYAEFWISSSHCDGDIFQAFTTLVQSMVRVFKLELLGWLWEVHGVRHSKINPVLWFNVDLVRGNWDWRIHTYIYIYIIIYIYIFIHTYIYIYIHTLNTHTHIYIYIRVCVYLCVCIYIYMVFLDIGVYTPSHGVQC